MCMTIYATENETWKGTLLGTGDLYIPRGDDANAGRVWERNNASTRDKANGKMGWEVGSIPYSIIQYQYV